MPRKPINAALITPEEIGKTIGMNPNSIRQSIREGAFPVGMALEGEKNYSYKIPRLEFENWINGQVPSNINRLVDLIVERMLYELSPANLRVLEILKQGRGA